jgi:hypothetical protein
MHEGILKMLQVPLVSRRCRFASAKTPEPIMYASNAVKIALIQLTLSPAVFVIHPGRQAELPSDTVALVTECGNVVVELPREFGESESDGLLAESGGTGSHPFFFARDIRQQPYSDNCRLAWLCRDYRADPRDRDRILRSLSRERDRTLTEAAGECRYSTDPISAVLSLVCADFAEADLHETPIGPTTRIRTRHRKGDFA